MKRNLFDCNFLPKGKQARKMLFEFITWYRGTDDKNPILIVALGGIVNGYLKRYFPNYIAIKHPAFIAGTKKEAEYVRDAVEQIQSAIKEREP